MRDLLKRGIAVHHSGILPIIKEVSLKSVCTLQWVWRSIVFRLLDVQLIPLVEMCVCVHFLIHLFVVIHIKFMPNLIRFLVTIYSFPSLVPRLSPTLAGRAWERGYSFPITVLFL